MKTNPTPIRIPAELKTYLQACAAANHRSLSGEIVSRLEQSRQAERRQQESRARD